MHTPRRLLALLVVVGLPIAGCSDDVDGVGSLAVGDVPPASIGDTVPVDTVPVDTVPADTVPVDTVPVETVPTGADTAVAETVPASDEDQIRYAYETWIVFDTPADVRASLIEGGEAQEAEIQAGFEEHEAIVWDATIEVDAVTLLDADHAEVVFRVLWGGRPSPYFPDPLTGTAVREGGWRISRVTLCALFVGTFGTECSNDGPSAPATASSTGSPTTAVPQPVVVWVSNQSFDVPSVDLRVSVDGGVIADQTFTVDQQHTYVRFDLVLAPGEHVIDVEAKGRGAAAVMSFLVDDPEWVTAFFWDDADGAVPIRIEHHEEAVGFY